MASCMAHYIKVLQREQVGSWKEKEDLERELNVWLKQYVADQENPPSDVRSRRPLRAARRPALATMALQTKQFRHRAIRRAYGRAGYTQ